MSRILLLLTFCLGFLGSSAHAYLDEAEPSFETFSEYRPFYFLLGSQHSKFQISFKAKIVESVPLYFAYTQTSFWNIFQDSSPFYDTTYAPDLFYRHSFSALKYFDFGYSHESNGKAGDDSRAWNRIFIRYAETDKLPEKSFLHWTLQAWVPFVEAGVNETLPRNRGIMELNLSWSKFLGPFFDQDDLILRIYPGGNAYINPLLGGQELTLRLKSANRKFLPLFVFQFFHGYGEDLLDSGTDVTVVRAGIGF